MNLETQAGFGHSLDVLSKISHTPRMLDWQEERIPGSSEEASDPYADHVGNAALSVQTELLIILPKEAVQTVIMYSKLVVKSQSYWSDRKEKRHTFSSYLWETGMSQTTTPTLTFCLTTAWALFNQDASEEADCNSFCLFLAVILAIPGEQTVFCAWIVTDFHRSCLCHFNYILKIQNQMQYALV